MAGGAGVRAGPKAYSPMIVGRASVQGIAKDAGWAIPSTPVLSKTRKGRIVGPSWLRNPKFVDVVDQAVSRNVSAEWELGHGGVERFREHLLNAFDLLSGTKVTATALLGQLWELIAPDLKEVRGITNTVAYSFRDIANEAVTLGKTVFVDGRLRKVQVSTNFTPDMVALRDIWIRVPGQAKGVKYCDYARLFRNPDGQLLLMRGEYKTRGAAGGLREQVGNMDERLREVAGIDGVEIHYTTVNRETGEVLGHDSTSVHRLVLMPGAADAFGRMGVKAGSKWRGVRALDSNGEPYIRVTAAVRTDGIRQAVQEILRDPRWQRADWAPR